VKLNMVIFSQISLVDDDDDDDDDKRDCCAHLQCNVSVEIFFLKNVSIKNMVAYIYIYIYIYM